MPAANATMHLAQQVFDDIDTRDELKELIMHSALYCGHAGGQCHDASGAAGV